MVQDAFSSEPVESRPPRPSPVRDSVVLGAAVGVFGLTFGVLASESGLSVAQACAMSLLVFTGASQIAAVTVVGAGGGAITAVASALLLAARNGVYGLTLASRLRVRGPRRAIAAQLIIDESTAMAVAQPDEAALTRAFWWTGLSVFVCWNTSTLIGALAGNAIGDPQTLGLDAAFPAGFIALLAPQIRERPKLLAAVLGAGIAAAAVPLSRPGIPVLAAAFGAAIAFGSMRGKPTGGRP